MPSSIRVECHRCGYEWTYMGSKVERAYQVSVSGRPVRIGCPRCRASIRLEKIAGIKAAEE